MSLGTVITCPPPQKKTIYTTAYSYQRACSVFGNNITFCKHLVSECFLSERRGENLMNKTYQGEKYRFYRIRTVGQNKVVTDVAAF